MTEETVWHRRSHLRHLVEVWRKEAGLQWDNEGVGLDMAANQLEAYLDTGTLPEMPEDRSPVDEGVACDALNRVLAAFMESLRRRKVKQLTVDHGAGDKTVKFRRPTPFVPGDKQ